MKRHNKRTKRKQTKNMTIEKSKTAPKAEQSTKGKNHGVKQKDEEKTRARNKTKTNKEQKQENTTRTEETQTKVK